MRFINYSIFILVTSLLLSNVRAETPSPIHKSGKLPSGTTYDLIIEESPYTHPHDAKSNDADFWGVDGGFPENSVHKFVFILGGNEVFIPRKYYSDMSHVISVVVKQGNKKIVMLEITGGDGVAAYDSVFKIKNNHLVERITRLGEFPEEVWERVILHNDVLDHPEKY